MRIWGEGWGWGGGRDGGMGRKNKYTSTVKGEEGEEGKGRRGGEELDEKD